ncbi:MAG: septum site-determining protein MinD [Ruminococcaceae bacterium]|nr:septum site-determining protein MinD [Oscillospiraceae bacterium]
MSKVILFTSGKGGTGKSTLSASVGHFLAKSGKKTLLIETDSGLRALDIPLNVQDRIVFDISDVFNSSCEMIKAIYHCPHNDDLHLIAAPFDESYRIRRTDLIRLCSGLKFYYDYIILDSPAGMGENLISAICAADMAVIVSSLETAAVRDAAKMSQLIDKYANVEKRFIINKADKESIKVMPFADFDEIVDYVRAQLLGVVPMDRFLRAACEHGTAPIVNSPGGQAAMNIAQRLMGKQVPLLVDKL